MSNDKKTFPLENILTISARDYCESVGKELSDYELKGVHVFFDFERSDSAFKSFLVTIPENAEVITDYRAVVATSNSTRDSYNLSGIALIPKPANIPELPR